MEGSSRGGSDPAGAAAPAAPLCVLAPSTAHAGLAVASARSAPHRFDSLRAVLSAFQSVSFASRSLCPADFNASHFRARWRITFAAFTSVSSTRAHRMQRNAFPLRFSASTCPHSASVRLESMAGSLSATPPAASMAFASVVCVKPHSPARGCAGCPSPRVSERLAHRSAHDVLRCDELDLGTLPARLAVEGFAHRRVGVGEGTRGVGVGVVAGVHRAPHPIPSSRRGRNSARSGK